jgi:hypothetical protein
LGAAFFLAGAFFFAGAFFTSFGASSTGYSVASASASSSGAEP